MNRKDFLLKGAGLLIMGAIPAWAMSQMPESEKKKYTIISKRCDGCGHCLRACKEKALSLTREGYVIIDQQKCKGCGDCMKFCRRMAIVESVQN